MKKLMLTLAILMLSACGFHLKGQPVAGEDAHNLPYANWNVNGGQIQEALVQSLRNADGHVTKSSIADAEITVTNVQTQKDIYTITRGAQIDEYLMTLRVEAHASRRGGAWGARVVIVVRRAMDYSESGILGKQEDEAELWSEMRIDAADQIVRRLTFLKAK